MTFGNILYSTNLYQDLLAKPLKDQYQNLWVVSGYASSALVRHLLTADDKVKLHLIIGMARADGIANSDHLLYVDSMQRFSGRFSCYYNHLTTPIHIKAYVWDKQLAFVGSPNFSWSGLTKHYEAVSYSVPDQVYDMFHYFKDQMLPADAPNVQDYITLFDARRSENRQRIARTHSADNKMQGDSVRLSLLDRKGNIHNRSGLNWGQRPGRNPDQAYIPVPRRIHETDDSFFPVSGERFTIETDDGRVFSCVIAQHNDKAIETPDDNSILGRYFRERLGVPSGEFVTKADLETYGRTDVEITKIDIDTYYLDFSV